MIELFQNRKRLIVDVMCDAALELERCPETEQEENFRRLAGTLASYSVYLNDSMETDDIDRLIEELQLTKAENSDDVPPTERVKAFYKAVREECDCVLETLDDSVADCEEEQ